MLILVNAGCETKTLLIHRTMVQEEDESLTGNGILSNEHLGEAHPDVGTSDTSTLEELCFLQVNVPSAVLKNGALLGEVPDAEDLSRLLDGMLM